VKRAAEGVALLISSDFPPVSGGQSRYLFDLWSCWPADRVIILAPAVEGAEAVDAALGARVVRVPLRDGRLSKLIKPLLLLRAAGRVARRHHLRSCHCGQLLSAGSVGWWLHLRHGVPYYPYVYGADLLEFLERWPWGGAIRAILARARQVVACSCFTGRAVERAGVEPGRIVVVNPSIDVGRFAGGRERETLRVERGWQDCAVLLSVGRLVERKGHDMVLRALPRVAGVVPQVRYAIAGTGPHREALERLARELGVEERVEFLGFVPEPQLPELYAAADLFAMVSRELPERGDVEGFGIVYLEAAAAGLASLAGRSGGVEDAVVHEETGLLVDPRDEQAVTAVLIQLLTNTDLRARLAAAGRERVMRDFDRRQHAARLWAVSA
jgi:phosphatidyl-myo-inositol dimannoside synthase